MWSDRRESSRDTGHFDGRCKVKAGDVDTCPVVWASTGILWGVEGAPLASAPRGEVTADSGPFIPRVRLSQPFFAAKDSNSSDIPHPSLISVSIWGRPPSLLTLPPQPPWGVVRAGTLCCCFDGKETKAKQTVGPRSQGSSCPPPFCFNWGLWWKESTFCCQKHRGLILVFATSWLGWVGHLGHRSSPL